MTALRRVRRMTAGSTITVGDSRMEREERVEPVERKSSAAPANFVQDDAVELESKQTAANPPAPAWQPVPTRRTVMPVESAARAGYAANITRDLACELGAGGAAPARTERLLWVAVGALGMWLCLRIARRWIKRE